jgi:hypothetical protein
MLPTANRFPIHRCHAAARAAQGAQGSWLGSARHGDREPRGRTPTRRARTSRPSHRWVVRTRPSPSRRFCLHEFSTLSTSPASQRQCLGKPPLCAGHHRDRRRRGARHATATRPELLLVDLAIALMLDALKAGQPSGADDVSTQRLTLAINGRRHPRATYRVVPGRVSDRRPPASRNVEQPPDSASRADPETTAPRRSSCLLTVNLIATPREDCYLIATTHWPNMLDRPQPRTIELIGAPGFEPGARGHGADRRTHLGDHRLHAVDRGHPRGPVAPQDRHWQPHRRDKRWRTTVWWRWWRCCATSRPRRFAAGRALSSSPSPRRTPVRTWSPVTAAKRAPAGWHRSLTPTTPREPCRRCSRWSTSARVTMRPCPSGWPPRRRTRARRTARRPVQRHPAQPRSRGGRRRGRAPV